MRKRVTQFVSSEFSIITGRSFKIPCANVAKPKPNPIPTNMLMKVPKMMIGNPLSKATSVNLEVEINKDCLKVLVDLCSPSKLSFFTVHLPFAFRRMVNASNKNIINRAEAIVVPHKS